MALHFYLISARSAVRVSQTSLPQSLQTVQLALTGNSYGRRIATAAKSTSMTSPSLLSFSRTTARRYCAQIDSAIQLGTKLPLFLLPVQAMSWSACAGD